MKATPKSVLVTGAGGFIGRFLCARLAEAGCALTALAMPREDTRVLEAMGARVVRGDLTDPASIRDLCEGIDTVYHLAARVTYWGSRRDYYEAIHDATRNLLDGAAGKAHRFVHASSVVAIGLGPAHLKGWRESDGAHKTGSIHYGDAKLDAEGLVLDFHRRGVLRATILRPTNVIGPGSVWVSDAVANLSKPLFPLIDGGRWSASLVYVENLVDAFVLAGQKEIAEGQIYHVRDDYPTTWRQYFEDIARLMGKPVTRTTFASTPFGVAWAVSGVTGRLSAALRIKTTLTRHNVGMMGRDNDIDASKAKRDLGWKTTVSYEEALRRIGAWMHDQGLARPMASMASRQFS